MNGDFKPADRRPKSWMVPRTSSPNQEQTQPKAEEFQTPEQIAADEAPAAEPLVEHTEEPIAPTHPEPVTITSRPPAIADDKPRWYQRLVPHWPPGKVEYIELVVLLLVIGSGSWLMFFHHAPKPVATVHTVALKPKPKSVAPTTVASNLTGLQVNPSVNQQPVTAVMVENSDAARPQSGLGPAGVVFEAVAEGGVTRFMALYQDTGPSNVGPIRSARPYYIQWALGFDAAYAHVGGSPDALSDIKAWNVKDMDEFYNGGYYHRISSREAPHNVYTAVALLNQLESAKRYGASTYTSWPRKADAPSKIPTAATISLTLSGPDYDASYTYNPTTNSYERSEGGAPQMDANTNTQISPKVVIAMVIPETQGALDATGAYYSDYASVGSGAVDVFEDGTVTTGTWNKASNTAQLSFTDSSGQPIKLDAGQTWLTAVSTSGAITYKP